VEVRLAKRQSPRLTHTAESIGTALGQVAAKLHAWKQQRTELALQVTALARAAQAMLGDLGHVETPAPAKRKGGRPKGYATSDETKAKLRAAWARRKQAAKIPSKPADERARIRATEGRKFTARQRGRG
jgi:hypothetical protein